MTNQGNTWEKEYRNPKLVTNNDKPQKDTLQFLKFLKKEQKFRVEDKSILDIGCGTGRNANYLAEMGNKVIGIEISKTALNLAKERANKMGVEVDYRLGDIGLSYDISSNSIDVVLDVTSSNSLDEVGRKNYLEETHRVLKPNGPASTQGGYFFVRALAKDGNKNVKNLLKKSHGKEYDTYYIPELDLTERVFSREDFMKMYSQYFKILSLTKKTSYSTMNNRIYKRDYWLAYMQK